MKTTKLIKSKVDKTVFLCECGNPVLEAFFDKLGYLHTAGVEKCFQCGRIVNEDNLDEDEVEFIE